MAKLGGTFDARSVEPNAPLEALPAGEYRVQILQSEMRVTKAGTGRMLWLDMEVLDGEHKGRHLYDQLNLVNPNPTAEEIAQRTLSAICHATGKLEVSDSEELHFAPIRRTSMESGTLAPGATAGNDQLPADRPTCRAAIAQLSGEIEAIRTQIATTDLDRQARRTKMDPRWYHRARTAISHKRQRIAALQAHMRVLPSDRKVGLKDYLIEVLRDEFDDEAWRRLMDRAHALHDQREGR